jgi:glycosyltransferase involved in cell wall biosynthesis
LGAGEKAITEHLQRRGSDGVVEPLMDLRMYRVRYRLPKSVPLVSLIIPTRYGLRLLRRCFESILEQTTYQHYEIVLVDNGSDDLETLRYLESIQGDSRVRIIRDNRPFNYSQLINSAVASGFLPGVREAGYRNIYTPYAEWYHHESATRGDEDTAEKQLRFSKESTYMKQRWGDLLLNDPAYSPNLTLEFQDFSLAWPPRVELVVPSR